MVTKSAQANIIGLPQQEIEDIAADLKLLELLQPEMILNTPFTPQELTIYENTPKGDFQLLLKSTAISRLLLKKSQIIVAGSISLFSLLEKKRLFEIGADTLILEPLINGELRQLSSDQ